MREEEGEEGPGGVALEAAKGGEGRRAQHAAQEELGREAVEAVVLQVQAGEGRAAAAAAEGAGDVPDAVRRQAVALEVEGGEGGAVPHDLGHLLGAGGADPVGRKVQGAQVCARGGEDRGEE